ncbi:hypothetical protein SAMN04488128_105320 [Chitinophaga eiseniae]|uniref:Uncharacterized protein n=1 Tax=Chitinophaga eiseniae TaxID=634771 RepID=A0A1T4TL48_9BACT|nr:hypothetical protein [Chitinophaga eiseniae]SKA41028.1 hypothetical protein SAMN04488128_105320 [Chitinophaga eiseniae]
MTYVSLTAAEISGLLYQFESCTLPKAAWTHEAHLIVAVVYNLRYGKAMALEMARLCITRYNEAVGTPNTDESGYHETITCFWIWMADAFLQAQESTSMEKYCSTFIRSRYTNKNFPLQFYSHALLFSVAARKRFVAPDLAPLSMTDITTTT